MSSYPEKCRETVDTIAIKLTVRYYFSCEGQLPLIVGVKLLLSMKVIVC